MQPQAASINYVPTAALRQSAPQPLQQVLNAFPLPTPGAPDLGNGLSEFIGGWSNPSNVDAVSARLDHNLGRRTHLFFRFSDTPSTGTSRGASAGYTSPSMVTSAQYLSRTYTLGATVNIARGIDNDFRLNFSSNRFQNSTVLDGYGGAVPADLVGLSKLQGYPNAAVTVAFSLGAYFERMNQQSGGATQKQWNLVDTVNVNLGKHELKIGIDWRRLTPYMQEPSPTAQYFFYSTNSVLANSVDAGTGQQRDPFYPIYTNFSAFVQDSWRVGPRITVSSGIRWDINPAPGVSKGLMPYTVAGMSDLSTMTLASQGTPLWKTDWYSLAPRLGFAYIANTRAEHETVIRGGGGVFFDTGQQAGSYGFQGVGFAANSYFGTNYGTSASFPASVPTVTPAITNPPVAPYTFVYANPPHLQLPFAFQWNASIEQALGRSQSFTISYVGSNGRKLLEESLSNVSPVNPNVAYL